MSQTSVPVLAHDIKVGDLVQCRDASASFGRLTQGAVYPVAAAFDGSPCVIASGAVHSLDRFDPV